MDVPDREREPQLTALGRRAFGALQPASEDVQLGLTHGALQAEQQPVVEVVQVIDPVRVDDQGVGQRGQLEQPLEVRAGARQP